MYPAYPAVMSDRVLLGDEVFGQGLFVIPKLHVGSVVRVILSYRLV